MHDITYANKIISLLKKEFTTGKIGEKIKVSVSLSPFTHVTADTLRAAFRALADREGFKNVTLYIKKEKVSIKCKKCGTLTKASSPVFNCPACKEADFDILNHQEFLIKAIEKE